MENTGVGWADDSWGPWWGCHKISEECQFCYACLEDVFYSKGVSHFDTHILRPRRFFGEAHWKQPLAFNRAAERTGRRRQVFCASMCDVLERLPVEHPSYAGVEEARARMWELVEQTPWLDWMLCTKRPEEFQNFLPKHWLQTPRPNVWLITTIGLQKHMQRVRELMAIPAVVHGVSCEPLLGLVVLPDYFLKSSRAWVITGGESGNHKGVRPSKIDHFRALRDQAVSANCFFHFKQWGQHNSDGVKCRSKHEAGRELDGRTWDERPVEGLKPGITAEDYYAVRKPVKEKIDVYRWW